MMSEFCESLSSKTCCNVNTRSREDSHVNSKRNVDGNRNCVQDLDIASGTADFCRLEFNSGSCRHAWSRDILSHGTALADRNRPCHAPLLYGSVFEKLRILFDFWIV